MILNNSLNEVKLGSEYNSLDKSEGSTRGVHLPKPMMHIAYSHPIFKKKIKIPHIFTKFIHFPHISSKFTFFRLIYAFMHHTLDVLYAPGFNRCLIGGANEKSQGPLFEENIY